MCDNDPASIEFFNKHLELMTNLGQNVEYQKTESVDAFFNAD